MSAASNISKNKKVIDSAFKRLLVSEYTIILDGMERLAKAGLEYLLDAHETHAMFMQHTLEDDTLAWALARDGRVLRVGAHHGSGDKLPGNATEKAKRVASSTNGWAVIILSEMGDWYREDLEVDFLVNAEYGISADFNKFFRRAR